MTAPSPEASEPPPAARSARLRAIVLIVLVVLLLGSAGTVVWLLAGRSGEADAVQRERDAVMAQARQFMLRSNTYGPADLDDAGKLTDNRAQVDEVVTDRFATEYDQSVQYVEQLVQTQGVGQTAKVLGIGVQYVDADSARALVAGESTFTKTGKDGAAEPVQSQTFRVVVDLVKVDDEWLVDKSEVVTDAEGSSETPAPTPSDAPSPSDGAGR